MVEKVKEIKQQVDKTLRDPIKPWTTYLDSLELKTGVDRLYIVAGSITFILLWLIYGFAARLVCNMVGFIYPAYASMHALETSRKEDDTKWLMYWIVFSLFSLVEVFADFIVGWFPLYWLVKCIFMVWLMIPGTFNGSSFLYNTFIRPYFLNYHPQIDDALGKVKQAANKYMEDTKGQ